MYSVALVQCCKTRKIIFIQNRYRGAMIAIAKLILIFMFITSSYQLYDKLTNISDTKIYF